MSDKTHMHGDGESYSGIVPAKQPNKSGQPPAEAVEGRPLTKENMDQPNQYRTQKRESWSSKLAHVREAARRDKKLRFTALLHHVTADLLRESFFALKRGVAPGVDGVTWQEYGRGLEERLENLHGRIHRGAYRALPSLRTWIPKPEKKSISRTTTNDERQLERPGKNFRDTTLMEHGAAVHVDPLAVDSPTFIGRKQQREGCDFFRRDQAILRAHFLQRL